MADRLGGSRRGRGVQGGGAAGRSAQVAGGKKIIRREVLPDSVHGPTQRRAPEVGSTKGQTQSPLNHEHYNSMYTFPPEQAQARQQRMPSRPPPEGLGSGGAKRRYPTTNIRRVGAPVQLVPKVEGEAQFGLVPAVGPPGPQLKALQDDVLRAVMYREGVLVQLHQLLDTWPSKRPPKAAEMASRQGSQYPEALRLLRNLCKELRECGLRCVEKVVAWVLHLDPEADEPTPFLWNKQDYLLKMYSDLDFVLDCLGPAEARSLNSCFCCRGNPLLLSEEELQGRGIRAQLGRAHAAGVVILDVVKRHQRNKSRQRRESLSSAGSETSRKRSGLGGSRGNSRTGMSIGAAGSQRALRPASSGVSEDIGETHLQHGPTGRHSVSYAAGAASPDSVLGGSIVDDDFVTQTKASATRRASRNQQEEEPPSRTTGRASAERRESVAAVTFRPIESKLQGPLSKGDMLGAYEIEATVGEGAYGWVFTGHKRGSNMRVAIKKFKDDEDEDEETANYAIKTQVRELKFLRKLKHPNIITLLDDFEDDDGLYFVFEYMPETCLQALERLQPLGLSPPTIRTLAQQLCDALLHCHKNKVMHRDIKPENLLVQDLEVVGGTPLLKLCDLGSARDEADVASDNHESDLTHYVGSRWYRAPELLGSSTHYTRAVDLWSAGCIIAEFLSNKPLFEAPSDEEMLTSMQSLLGPFPNVVAAGMIPLGLPRDKVTSNKPATRSLKALCSAKGGPEACELLSRLLNYDPQARLDLAPKLLQHPFFKASTLVDEERDKNVLEALRLLCGRSSKVLDRLRRLLQGAEKAEDMAAEVGRLMVDSSVAVMEGFMERFLQWATNREKVALLDGLLAAVEASCASRLAACKAWMGGRAMADLSLAELAEGLERKHVASNKNERRICEACLSVATRMHEDLSLHGVDDVASLQRSPINHLLTSISLLLLDPRSSSARRRTQLDHLFSLMGLPSPLDAPSLLTPPNKATLLLFRLADPGVKRLPLVLSRDWVFRDVLASLRAPAPTPTATSKTNRRPNSVSGLPALVVDGPVLLVPYFRSEYGKKVVDGQSVEEGEGLGPRKELFALLSAQLQQLSTRFDMDCVLHVSGSAGQNVLMAPAGATFPPEMAVGWKLHVIITQGPTPDTSVAEKRFVMRVHGESKVMVDKPWAVDFSDKRLDVFVPAHPLLIYHKPKECLWVNTQLARNEENQQRFKFLGVLLGLAVVNQCTMDLNLPPLFFKIMRAGGAYEPSMSDLSDYDPAVVMTLNSVKDLSQEAFEDLLRAEDLDPELFTRETYIRKSMVELLRGDGIAWIFDAVAGGMAAVLPMQLLEGLQVSDRDLMIMTCGFPQPPNEDFDFQEYFQVSADQELKSMPIWNILWDVVNSFDAKRKRKLLKFITGVNKLPSPGTELLKVESPFVSFSLDDHRKIISMLPQSHTCDNILELPNYYESLVRLHRAEHPNTRTPLPTEVANRIATQCARILETKLTQAVENSMGYGLDEVLSGPSHDEGRQPPKPNSSSGDKNNGGYGYGAQTRRPSAAGVSAKTSRTPPRRGSATGGAPLVSGMTGRAESPGYDSVDDDIPSLDESSLAPPAATKTAPPSVTPVGRIEPSKAAPSKTTDAARTVKASPVHKVKAEDEYGEEDYEDEFD